MLRQHRERLELMAQAAEIGFWFCDLPFDKLVWDDRVKEHFWYPSDAEGSVDMFYQRLHLEDRERTRETIERCIAKGQQYDIEYRTVADDGHIKWIRAIGSPFLTNRGGRFALTAWPSMSRQNDRPKKQPNCWLPLLLRPTMPL